MTYKLNEPYEGFVKNGDFVLGAMEKNLLKLFDKMLQGDIKSIDLSQLNATNGNTSLTDRIIY